jgi:tetratricopeptide (TPR) repeat protein
MGEVWRGRHEATGLPVAVKVLPRQQAAEATARRRFLAEVRAVAGLDHPHIVTVLDAGNIDTAAAAASRGRLREGSPWLAMELATAGNLLHAPPPDFERLRERLAQVLDALAYAHAHGVLHLDLKPSNLLLCARRDARPGLKLTDFGMARVQDESTMLAEEGGGTPAYMAPEQLLSESSQLGPWTDLYAVGCLAWALATGSPPYQQRTAVATARAALGKSLPAFVPRLACPAAFTDWLHALLARDPDARPRRAADALAALLELEADDDDDDDDEQTMSFGRPVITPDEPTQHGFDLAELREAAALDASGHAAPTRLPPPTTIGPWQRPRTAVPSALAGAGLGLLAVRRRPLVGRDAEQHQLWSELRLVHGARRPRLVVLRGEAGVGRTALGDWLAARAEEVGAARSWPIRGEPRPLERSVERWLRVAGLAEGTRHRRMIEQLGQAQADAVQALLGGELAQSARRGVVRRLIDDAARERPVVLWIDDAHLSPDLLRLAADVASTDDGVLVVVAVTEEALTEDHPASMLVDQLQGEVVTLEPLPMAARRELLDGLVGLAPELAEPVAARSGLPLFLLQLLGQWSEQGALVPSPRGLQLAEGVPLQVPDDLHHAWLQRVEEVLDELEPAAGWDLHVAATLGHSFEEAVWHTACDDPEGEGVGWEADGVTRRQQLAEALVARGLWRPEGDRLAFVHQLLQEALTRQATEMGRARWLHHACAHALVLHQVGDGARLGHHLLRAGEPAAAVAPLLEAVVARAHDRPADALQVLLLAEEAAHDAALPPTSLVSVALLVTRAEVHLAARERPEALRWSRWAQQAVHHHGAEAPVDDRRGWQEHLARALRVEHAVFVALGSEAEAQRALLRLEPVVRGLADERTLVDVLRERARAAEQAGRPDAADEALAEALRRSPTAAVRAAVRLQIAASALRRGDRTAASDALQRALDDREHLTGDPVLLGGLLALRGEVGLLDDDEEASELLAEAVDLLDATGASATRARLLVAVAEGPSAAAAAAARLQVDGLPPRSRLRPLAELALAITEARCRHWPAVHDAVARYESLQRPGAGRHPTETWLAAQLASEASEAGFPQLAQRVGGAPAR